MAGNTLNTPIQQSFTQGNNKNINDYNQLLGKQLPCHVIEKIGETNSIVTVAFDINSDFTLPSVTIPVLGFEYIRNPIQIGDKGAAIAFDSRLGGVSGLGESITNLTQPCNLGSLIFVPIGNINWSNVDPNALTMYGLNGVVIRDSASGSIITLTPTNITIVSENSVIINSGGTSMSLNSDGSFNISGSASGVISAAGGLSLSDATNTATISTMQSVFSAMITWMNSHVHSDPQGGDTGVASPAYSGGNPIS